MKFQEDKSEMFGASGERLRLQKTWGDKQNDSMNKKHKVVHNPMFTIAKKRKQRKCPSTEDWIKKMWYIYIQLNIVVGGVELLSYVLLFATS